METYRSGHNGTDSKSVVPPGTVGSNPTVSAKNENAHVGVFAFYTVGFEGERSVNSPVDCLPRERYANFYYSTLRIKRAEF